MSISEPTVRRGRVVLATVVVSLSLAACSKVPDYANPVEWYNSAVSVFDEGDATAPKEPPPPPPGADQAFPDLGTVPDKPPRETTVQELDAVREGLIADRKNARYTDEAIKRVEDVGATPPVTATAPRVTEAKTEPAPQPTPQPAPKVATEPLVQPSQTQTATSAPPPPPAPAPQPAPAPRSAPTVQVQQPQLAAIQPQAAAVPTPPAPGTGSAVDVRDLFADLFSASGPRAVVAPTTSTQLAYAAATGGQTTTAPATLSAPAPASVSAPATVIIGAGAPTAPAGNAAPGASVKAAEIYFGTGSARLSAKARKAIAEIAKAQRERGGRLRVVGHASRRTREMPLEQHQMVNFDISLRRAQAVAEELMRRGVPAEAVILTAKSDSDPVYYEWMPSGEAGNRRADIYFDN